MKIAALRLYTLQAPLKTPFQTALRTVTEIQDLIVAVETDTGEIGYGEAPPTAVITGDTLASVACAIREFIAPRLLGLDLEQHEYIFSQLDAAMVHNTSAKAAVDMAIYDLYAKRYRAPLYQLLGGYRTQVQTDVTISLNSVDAMVADSLRAVQDGFCILKIKVGSGAAEDLERVRAIRRAVPASTLLRVDANQAWTPKEAVRIITAMEEQGLNIELVEQPVRAADLEGLKFVTEHVLTDILADEAVFSIRNAADIIRMRAADLINIKLMKTGGIRNALAICSLAEAFDIGCMIGCMLETNVAITAAAHLAAAKKNIRLADLDGPALCSYNPVQGGARFQAGTITLPTVPGLGIDGIEGLREYPAQ